MAQDFLLFVLSAVEPHHAHGQHNVTPPVLSRAFKTMCFSLQNIVFPCSPAFQTQRPSKQATQTGCHLLRWFVLLKTNKTIQGNPWNMLSLLQHLSSDDFRMLYEAHGVLKSQGLPFFMEVGWNPAFTRSVGSIQQDTVLGFQKALTYSAHLLDTPVHTHPSQVHGSSSGSHPSPGDPGPP